MSPTKDDQPCLEGTAMKQHLQQWDDMANACTNVEYWNYCSRFRPWHAQQEESFEITTPTEDPETPLVRLHQKKRNYIALKLTCLKSRWKSSLGKAFHAMVSVMAVNIQFSSPNIVRRSLSWPGISSSKLGGNWLFLPLFIKYLKIKEFFSESINFFTITSTRTVWNHMKRSHGK